MEQEDLHKFFLILYCTIELSQMSKMMSRIESHAGGLLILRAIA